MKVKPTQKRTIMVNSGEVTTLINLMFNQVWQAKPSKVPGKMSITRTNVTLNLSKSTFEKYFKEVE